jgi:hypothetical protein
VPAPYAFVFGNSNYRFFNPLFPGPANTLGISRPSMGTEWVWSSSWLRVTDNNAGATSDVFLAMNVDSMHPMLFYAPFLVHVPAGTIGDNEAAEIALHASSWSDLYPVGTAGMVIGEDLGLASHVLTRGKSITVVAGPNAGAGAVVTRSGDDIKGRLQIVTGGVGGPGPDVMDVTFANPYPSTPIVIVGAGNANAAAVQPAAINASASGFSIGTLALLANTTYAFNYFAIG